MKKQELEKLIESKVRQALNEANKLIKSFKTNYAPYTTFNVYEENGKYVVKADTKGYGEFIKKTFDNNLDKAIDYAINCAKKMSDANYIKLQTENIVKKVLKEEQYQAPDLKSYSKNGYGDKYSWNPFDDTAKREFKNIGINNINVKGTGSGWKVEWTKDGKKYETYYATNGSIQKEILVENKKINEAVDTVYTIECHDTGSIYGGKNRYYYQTGTLAQLIDAYSYTLEVGESWQGEKGNHRINRNPRNVNDLVKNLNWAVNNSAADGYSGKTYRVLPEGEEKKG